MNFFESIFARKKDYVLWKGFKVRERKAPPSSEEMFDAPLSPFESGRLAAPSITTDITAQIESTKKYIQDDLDGARKLSIQEVVSYNIQLINLQIYAKYVEVMNRK